MAKVLHPSLAVAWLLLRWTLEVAGGCSASTLSGGLIVSGQASTSTRSNSIVSLACTTGYTSDGGNSSATCDSNNQWQFPANAMVCQPNCVAIQLNSYSSQASPTPSSSYATSTAVTLSCSAGYTSVYGTSGNGVCMSDGSWSWNPAGSSKLQCFRGCNPLVLTGASSSPAKTSYLLGDQVFVSCSSGYVSVNGSSGASCNQSGLWLWTGTGQPLTCVQTCTFPSAVTGITYVSPSTGTYKLGDTITAHCSTGYSNSSGSNTADCSAGGIWNWRNPGPLTCLQTCTAPTLTIGLTSVSSQTAIYMVGDTFTIGCSSSYVYRTGNETAECIENHQWSWYNGAQLQCTPACQPPTPGAFSSVTSETDRTSYVLNDVIQFQCNNGYMYASGGTSGTCTGPNTWTWSGAATAPLQCIVVPMFLTAIDGHFSSGTCNHYVQRPATTDGTCLMSCTYDGYCAGYAMTGTGCYHDRPQLSNATTTMACQIRY